MKAGLIFGFLRLNGAGKSTTIKINTTLALQITGKASLGGFVRVTQAAEVHRVSGLALQDIGIDPLMNSMELSTRQVRLFGAR